jgi:serine/threonine protein phosphatase 1
MRWIIGDVHGCLETLKALIAQIPSEHPISLVGDLVDRGPDSVGVVQYVIENKHRIDAIKGNHERMMIDHLLKKEDWQTEGLWYINGGKKVHASYKYKHGKNLLVEHTKFLNDLPYYREYKDLKDAKGRYLLVSHSIALDTDLQHCVDSQSLIWGRHFPEGDPSKGTWYNVFGHTPTVVRDPYGNPDARPWLEDYFANIDTGAAYGYPMTALCWPTMQYIQQENLDVKPNP